MAATLTLTARRIMFGQGQKKAYTGTAAAVDNAMPASASSVMVWCSSAAYVSVGVNPTATTADLPIPANAPVVIPLDNQTGAGWKVSAVQDSTGGNLYICPLAD